MNEFEDHLKRAVPRRIPGDWRREILATARASVSAPSASSRMSWWDFARELLWPAPAAWCALAAVWVLLLGVHFAGSGTDTPIRAAATPPPAEVLNALKEQRQLLWAELREAPQPPSRPIPGPRSRNDWITILAG